MKRNNFPSQQAKTLWLVLLAGFFTLTFSCNKDFENALPDSFPNDTLGRGAGKKVLYIIMDGVKGTALRALAPTNITAINTRAVYSFEGLADDRRNAITNAAGWSNLMTGVDVRAHGVQSEDFANFNVQATPTLFTRIKDNIANARTVSVAASATFNDKFATDASEKINAGDDAGVNNAAAAELAKANAKVVVAQFHGAEIAGAAGGYDANVPAYAAAIRSIDTYIGNLLSAIKARPTYSTENWLVVIVSNKGGAATSGGGANSNVFEDQSRNIYLSFHNPRFVQTLVAQPDPNSYPFIGASPVYVRTRTVGATTGTFAFATAKSLTLGNPGTGGELTVFVKVKLNKGNVHYWPELVNKGTSREASPGSGWSLYLEVNRYQLKIGSNTTYVVAGPDIRDARWHTVAFKLYTQNGLKYATLFTDGVKGATVDITAAPSIVNNLPIKIGSSTIANDANGEANNNIRDLAIYNVALSDDDILTNMRKEISVNIPRTTNLVGWWPCNEGSGTALFDKSGNANDMTLNANVGWINFNESSPFISGNIADEAYRSVPNGVDATLMIYNWLNIAVPTNWGLMGRPVEPQVILPTN